MVQSDWKKPINTYRLPFNPSHLGFGQFLFNILSPIMRTGPDFMSTKFDPFRGEAEDWVNSADLKSGPVVEGLK